MGSERRSIGSESGTARDPEELERVLEELREANERLVEVGVRMQELAERADRSRREAEASNRAKDEFLAALSHELRTPLNAILGWVHILRETPVTGAAAQRALEIIERNARLQAQLIADLLQVSQIITGKLRLEFERLDLAPCVTSIVEALRPTAFAKAIRLETRIDGGVPQVLADPSRLQQILWNVLSNAIKFTPLGGAVQLRLMQTGDSAEVSVIDSGVGIESDFLPHVFERFSQGDVSAKRGLGGLGLGLAIVKQLMELHGGSVACESAGAGCGSTFTLTFPAPAHAKAVARTTASM